MSVVLIRMASGLHTLVDAADLPLLLFTTWSSQWANCGDRRVAWAVGRVAGRSMGLHRLVMQTPPNMVTDHINGDGLDNRRSNLRNVTRGANGRNRHFDDAPLALGILPPGVPIVTIEPRSDWHVRRGPAVTKIHAPHVGFQAWRAAA